MSLLIGLFQFEIFPQETRNKRTKTGWLCTQHLNLNPTCGNNLNLHFRLEEMREEEDD